MTTNQEGLHATVRALTGTSRSYNEDWHALFDSESIVTGSFNSRMLAWINASLSTSYTNVNEAMQAFAVDQGFSNWSSMNTFEASRLARDLLGEIYNGFAVDGRDNTYAMRTSTDAEILLDGEIGLAIAMHVNQYAMRV